MPLGVKSEGNKSIITKINLIAFLSVKDELQCELASKPNNPSLCVMLHYKPRHQLK